MQQKGLERAHPRRPPFGFPFPSYVFLDGVNNITMLSWEECSYNGLSHKTNRKICITFHIILIPYIFKKTSVYGGSKLLQGFKLIPVDNIEMRLLKRISPGKENQRYYDARL